MSTDTPEIYSTATGAKIDQHKRCGELERENARLREELAIQSNANVGLMEELAEAKRELELSRAVAHLSKLGAEQAEARALANEKDAGRLNAMSEHEWRIGWNREGDLCRVWAEDMEGNRDPVCGWDKFFPDHRAAIDAAIGAKHD